MIYRLLTGTVESSCRSEEKIPTEPSAKRGRWGVGVEPGGRGRAQTSPASPAGKHFTDLTTSQ